MSSYIWISERRDHRNKDRLVVIRRHLKNNPFFTKHFFISFQELPWIILAFCLGQLSISSLLPQDRAVELLSHKSLEWRPWTRNRNQNVPKIDISVILSNIEKRCTGFIIIKRFTLHFGYLCRSYGAARCSQLTLCTIASHMAGIPVFTARQILCKC